MKKVSILLLAIIGFVGAATVYKGGRSPQPYDAKRPWTWQFDVQIGASETVYSGPINLLGLPLALSSGGDTVRLTATGNYIAWCNDVSDSTGGADSALVSFLPQYSNFASDNINPDALQSDTWTATADSVQLADRSDSIYTAKTAVKNVTLPTANTRFLRFKVVNRSATVKNAGQRCKVAVTFKELLR